MNKKWFAWILAVAVVLLFGITGLHAGTAVPDVIKMDSNNYTKRTKAPPKYKFVTFTHKKHAEDYGSTCGDCHHDNSNKPLDIKVGDNVQKCSECHNIMKKTKENRRDIMVLENAMHGNCLDCHKEANIEAGDPKGKKGPAPMSCNKCHAKK